MKVYKMWYSLEYNGLYGIIFSSTENLFEEMNYYI